MSKVIDRTKPIRRVTDKAEARYFGVLPGSFPHLVAYRLDRPDIDSTELWTSNTYTDEEFVDYFENVPPAPRQKTLYLFWTERFDHPLVFMEESQARFEAKHERGHLQEVTITEERQLPW